MLKFKAAEIFNQTQHRRAMKSCSGNGKTSREVFEMQAVICKAFANPIRLEMLDLLGKGEWIVGDLQKELGISKANMSQHIAVLKAAGVVTTRRDGKQFHCSLAIPEVKQACQLIHNVLRAQVRKGRSIQI